jgi:D-glycero-D-manno-heptose 1,7-bisphosphate phosphatase
MIRFHGRPFLEYLVEQLASEQVERIVLLLGYLPEQIIDHLGDGGPWGVRIDYLLTPPDALTGTRLSAARDLLDPVFLLLYCDNYAPLRIDDLWRRYLEADVPALLTVHRRTGVRKRGGVSTDEAGFIVSCERANGKPQTSNGIEIGYGIISRDVLGLLPDEGEIMLEDRLYPELAARRQLAAYVTEHRYYTVGTFAQLPRTAHFLARRPAILVDRDGVLNRRPERAHYVRSWRDFEWLDGARDGLRLLTCAGFLVIVATNQPGIGRGIMAVAELEEIHDHMRADAAAAGGEIAAVYYCPHDWSAACACRKPQPGLLYQAQRDFDLDLSRVHLVGDDERDGAAAIAAGCRPILMSNGRTLADIADEVVSARLRCASS